MSSQQEASTMTSRQLWVANKAGALTAYFRQLKLLQLAESLDKSEADIRLQDGKMREKYKKDKETLATHISHMNTATANIVLLKGGILPAMKIDPENQSLKGLAIFTMSYIKAEYEYMVMCLMN